MASEALQGVDRSGTGRVRDAPGVPRPAPEPAPAEVEPTAEELASVRDTVLRLRTAYPSAEPAAVEAAVTAAYDSFRGARIRNYVAILAERRSRKALSAAFRAAPGPEHEGEAKG
ncbi:three-helix bundle dimerization domain-containing protein [Streptomyces sp. NPDC093514]|uniref:three-helix bundle dimerization domain-containing protein n=1 Tax=Streptomyces sp. NPDC093514 TaxID=3366039 RepID=UPI003811A5B1